jgi:hypothetical protein
MELIPYNLESWQLNTNYDLVKNCRVTKPPYEKEWFYSSEFFLDKRYSIENLLPLINQDGREFLDYIDANWYRYYYYKVWTDKTYIWTFDSNGDFQNITPLGFIVNEDSPLRLTKWFWAYRDPTPTMLTWANINKTIYRWVYESTTSYAVDDIVTYGSDYYLCIAEATTQLPSNVTYWSSVAAWLPSTYTWYTLTFTSNLDNNPSVVTIDWVDVLAWAWWYNNEELARDTILENFKLVFPTYIITRVWLKYIFNNASTPVVISLNTTSNALKKIEFSWEWTTHSKISLYVDAVEHTTTWDVTANLEDWICTIIGTWYKVARIPSWNWIIFANNVWTYSPTNSLWASITITKTEYDRYTYTARWSIYVLWVYFSAPDLEKDYQHYMTVDWMSSSYELTSWLTYSSTAVTVPILNTPLWNYSSSNSKRHWLKRVDMLYDLLNTSYTKDSSMYLWWSDTSSWSEVKKYWFNYYKNDYTAITLSQYSYEINPDLTLLTNYGNWFYLDTYTNKAVVTITNYIWTVESVSEEQVWFVSSIPSYDNWYLSLDYTGTITYDSWYLLFTTWALKWVTVKFESNDAGKLFLLWTDIRWTIPSELDEFKVFRYTWDNIYVWWTEWLYQVTLDWVYESPSIIQSLTPTLDPIIWITKFNWSIFALTKSKVYYSNYSTYSNWDFYVLNFFNVIGWYRLFNIWKSIVVFAWENKIISPVVLWEKQLFWMYDLNYNWNLFSKYSCIFADQTMMMYQDDKQLMECDIIETAKNTFDISVKQVSVNVRWLFDNIFWWEVFFDNSDNELILLNVKEDALTDSWYSTTTYVYNKQHNHWTVNEYAFKINNFWTEYRDIYWIDRPAILWINHLSTVSNNYLDLWTIAYDQEVNMRLWDWERLMMPYIIRTLFGMPDTPLDITLETSFEIWGKKEIQEKNLTWFEHDLRITTPEESLDDLIWFDNDEFSYWAIYDWSVVWIQSNIMKTWRFVFFKYHSTNRFVIWKSFVITDKTKTFINELTLTN